jgi:GNAT superfamily N-acetyltransferase
MPGQPPRVTFTPVSESDFEALAAMRIEAMRDSLERIGRFDPARATERLRSGFSTEHTKFIVSGMQRIGFVVVKPQDNHLLLDHLYVLPVHYGRGIGAKVLQWVFEQADLLHLPIKVGALRESESNRFYARHGFKLVEQGEFDNYYVRSTSRAR